jgi:ribulose-bisphosphate carboxylase large chain
VIKLRYIDFVDLDYVPSDSDLICEFHVESSGSDLKVIAGGVAAESSVGTWTELTTAEPYVVEKAANVFEMKGNEVKIAYPIELFEEGNMPNILSSIAGNVFGLDDVKNLRLNDIHFPEELVNSFKGPKFGVSGVRKLLGVPERPLVGTIVKPKLGLITEDHARVAYDAWSGGCDIVKDDENLASQDFNPFEERVVKTLEKRDQAEEETGEIKVYMVNVTAEVEEMKKRLQFIEDQGGRYMMIDIITTGWGSLQTVRELDYDLVIHAHRAGHAAFTRSPVHGINMVVVSKIARLLGVDQLHIGAIVGKMSETEEEVMDNREAIMSDMYGIKRVFPVASGGLHPGSIPQLLHYFGNDVIVQAGGGIHGHPQGSKQGATAMRQAVEATFDGVSLREYAKDHNELALALEKWKLV